MRRAYESIESQGASKNGHASTPAPSESLSGSNANGKILEAGEVAGDYSADWKGSWKMCTRCHVRWNVVRPDHYAGATSTLAEAVVGSWELHVEGSARGIPFSYGYNNLSCVAIARPSAGFLRNLRPPRIGVLRTYGCSAIS